MRPRARITIVVAFALAAVIAALARIAAPRVARELRIERAIRAARAGVGDERMLALEDLVHADRTDALLALIDDAFATSASARWQSLERDDRVVRAVELFAATPESELDARPRARLEAIATDPSRKDADRLMAGYLLEELAEPSHAREPPGFTHAIVRWEIGNGGDAVERVAEELSREFGLPIDVSALDTFWHSVACEDRAWRALVAFAQSQRARLVLEPSGAKLRPRVRATNAWFGATQTVFSNADETWKLDAREPARLGETSCFGLVEPEKQLRAIARLRGLVVRKISEHELEATKP